MNNFEMQRSKCKAEFKAEAVKQLVDKGHQKQTLACDKAVYLTTAGGKIRCLRCNALSKRTGAQCGRPASKGSKTQKCHMHGGRGNSAPKTDEGRQRVAAAHTKSGEFTNAAKLEQSKSSARLAQLEDAMHVLGMTTAVRTRGRKSNLYVPLTTVDDVRAMLVDEILHKDRGSNGH